MPVNCLDSFNKSGASPAICGAELNREALPFASASMPMRDCCCKKPTWGGTTGDPGIELGLEEGKEAADVFEASGFIMSTKTLPIACVFAIFRENEHFAATEILVNFLGEAGQAYGIVAGLESLLCVYCIMHLQQKLGIATVSKDSRKRVFCIIDLEMIS